MLAFFKRMERDIGEFARDTDEEAAQAIGAALKVLEFGSLLRKGVFIVEETMRLDEEFRRRAYRSELQYTQEMDRAFLDLLTKWHEPHERILATIDHFEGMGLPVPNAAEFREACRSVAAMLTPDAEFFSGDALLRAQDEALAEFRRGECEDVEA